MARCPRACARKCAQLSRAHRRTYVRPRRAPFFLPATLAQPQTARQIPERSPRLPATLARVRMCVRTRTPRSTLADRLVLRTYVRTSNLEPGSVEAGCHCDGKRRSSAWDFILRKELSCHLEDLLELLDLALELLELRHMDPIQANRCRRGHAAARAARGLRRP